MKLLELLKLLEIVNMDSSFPMSQSTLDLDSWFKSYRYLKISALLWLGSQPLSMQQILPKSAQRKNFEIPPKCIQEAIKHVSTVLIFNPRIFHMLFLLSQNGLSI
jgi:hypothetical protein